jgi:hypothetical protein
VVLRQAETRTRPALPALPSLAAQLAASPLRQLAARSLPAVPRATHLEAAAPVTLAASRAATAQPAESYSLTRKMNTSLSTFFKNWWPLILTAGSCIAGYSTLASDVSHIEQREAAQVSDHDLLQRVDTRQQRMEEDVKEMKSDLKEIREAVK